MTHKSGGKQGHRCTLLPSGMWLMTQPAYGVEQDRGRGVLDRPYDNQSAVTGKVGKGVEAEGHRVTWWGSWETSRKNGDKQSVWNRFLLVIRCSVCARGWAALRNVTDYLFTILETHSFWSDFQSILVGSSTFTGIKDEAGRLGIFAQSFLYRFVNWLLFSSSSFVQNVSKEDSTQVDGYFIKKTREEYFVLFCTILMTHIVDPDICFCLFSFLTSFVPLYPILHLIKYSLSYPRQACMYCMFWILNIFIDMEIPWPYCGVGTVWILSGALVLKSRFSMVMSISRRTHITSTQT